MTWQSSITVNELLTKRELVLDNGQQISILFKDGVAVCFRPEKSSIWESIGEENWSLAIAMNRLEQETNSEY